MEIARLLLMLSVSGVVLAESNVPEDHGGEDYWPTRSELVMPGGRQGVQHPQPESDQGLSGGRRRSKTVVVSVRPANQATNQQQHQRQQQNGETITVEQWQGRQRNKHLRLFQLQQQIMQKLRLNGKPNVTGSEPLSPQQIETLQSQMSRRAEGPEDGRAEGHKIPGGKARVRWDTGDAETSSEDSQGTPDEYNSKRFLTLPPACPKDTAHWFTEGSELRVFFLIEPPMQTRHQKTRVTSALLRLRRKSFDFLGGDETAAKEDDNVDNDAEDYYDNEYDDVTPTTQRERSKRGHVVRSQPRKSNKQKEERKRQRQIERSRRTVDRRRKGSSRLTLGVYQYTQPVEPDLPALKEKVKSVALRYPYLERGRADWITINVKAAVREWYKDPDTNYGFELVITDENNNSVDPRAVFYWFNCSEPISSADAAALMSLSMRDTNDRQRNPSQRVTSSLSDITLPNLYLSTVDTPRRDRKRKLRARRGDAKK